MPYKLKGITDMKTIKIFLASSIELKSERENFEIELTRKNKFWIDKGINLTLEIWEDLSARMSSTRSQDEYNKKIKESDIFVLLAFSKVGMYTEEEFEIAFGSFKKKEKPFIFTYFKNIETGMEHSLEAFKNKLKKLGHFYSSYSSFDNLWNQFNKELDRLLINDFTINNIEQKSELKIDNRGANIKYQFIKSTLNYGGKKIQKLLGNIPIKPNIFLGRDNSTYEIKNHLLKNQNLLVLLNGEGGIGKTTLAAQYYYTYFDFYKHLIWIVPEKGIKDALASLAIPLGLSFSNSYTIDQQINEVVKEIIQLKNPVLLIIDNANNLDDLEKNYPALRKLHNIHILLTSRINNITHIDTFKVEQLSKKDLISLFKSHYPAFQAQEEEFLVKILKATGCNTLVTELLAKNLAKLNDELTVNYSLQNLLNDIQSKGILAITESEEVYTDYRLSKATPEEIIMAMYDISDMSEDKNIILSVFAVLPPVAIPFSDLDIMLGNIDRINIKLKDIFQEGWIDYDRNTKSFKLSPVISDIIRTKNQNFIKKNIRFLIRTLIDRLDYEAITGVIQGDFEETLRFIGYAENVVIYKDFIARDYHIIFDRIGNYYQNYGNLDKALIYYEERSKLLKVLQESNHNNLGFRNGLAICYERLGSTHTSLGNLDIALKYFKNYFSLMKEQYESSPNNESFKNALAISYGKLGSIYNSLGNLDKALKYFENEKELFEELYENNCKNLLFKNGLAISYSKLGSIHTSLGDLNKALTYYEDDLKLTKELYECNPNNIGFKNGLAISYEKLGETHAHLGNMDKALKYFEERSRLSKELYESNPNNVGFKNGLAISYSNLGTTYTFLRNFDKALSYFEDFLSLMKELNEKNPNNVDFKNGLSKSYDKLGDTHTSLGNIDKAMKYYEEHSKIRKELFESNPHSVDFKNGLAISYENLGDIHTSLGNLDKALKYFEERSRLGKELNESNPNNVGFQNRLAISYSKLGTIHISLGNYKIALKYFEDAVKLTKELHEKKPNIISFKTGLAISYEKLGNLLIYNLNNKHKGLEHLYDARNLLKQLMESYPKYKEFQRNYYRINNSIENIK